MALRLYDSVVYDHQIRDLKCIEDLKQELSQQLECIEGCQRGVDGLRETVEKLVRFNELLVNLLKGKGLL